MTDRLDVPGAPGLGVDVRRSARARRMTLRVSSLDGKVTLTVPRGTAQSACARFLDGHARVRNVLNHHERVGEIEVTLGEVRCLQSRGLEPIDDAGRGLDHGERGELADHERTRDGYGDDGG